MTSLNLVLTKELAEAVEQSEIDALHSRLTAIKEINGNPMGVDIKKFGNATAFSVKNIPGPSFNTVKGLRDGDEKYIDNIRDFYNNREIPMRLELTPANTSPKLLSYLNKTGFYHSDFHTALYSPINQDNELIDSNISIRLLEKNEFDTFADIYTQAFEMPSYLKSGVAQNNEILYNSDNWFFYVANIENEPAGIGVLFINDGIACLAAAATVPHLRNKGVQNALILKRINQAKNLECKLVLGQAKFGSVSQNNMEKVGLKIAYTKAIWIKQ